MDRSGSTHLVTQDGQRATLNFDTQREGLALIQFESGQQVLAPVDLLEEQEDGSYYLPVNMGGIDESKFQETYTAENHQPLLVVPVIQEEVRVDKQRRVSGRVQVKKHISSREEVIDEPTYVEEVNVERVPMNRQIDAPLSAHYEGDTLIIPLMEEVLVVEKRLMLREELHVKKQRREIRRPQAVTLRREEASVERLPGDSNAPVVRVPPRHKPPE